jgi:signal transduction histidine kinase
MQSLEQLQDRIFKLEQMIEKLTIENNNLKNILKIKGIEFNFEKILNSMQEHVIFHSTDLVIKWANVAAAKSINKTQDEIVGKKCHQLWQHSEHVCEGCPVIEAKRTLKPVVKIMTTDDGRKWLVKGLPLLEDGKLKGLIKITSDLTTLHKAHEELYKLNRELEERVKKRTRELKEANEEMKAFSYSVSHDLRAPLRSINGFSKALLEDYSENLPEKGHHFLERIVANSELMAEQISGLLKISRLSRRELNLEKADLLTIASEVFSELKKRYTKRKIEFKTTGEHSPEKIDPILIRIVLTNLMDNALKFTKNKKITKIEFGRKKTDSESVYYIKDNGIGFSMEKADRLFTVFQRLHSKEAFRGTGIGLTSAKRIIDKHKGKIWAEGKKDKGATFYFKLGDIDEE